MTKNECPCCGVEWDKHKGIVWTCEEMQKYRELSHELCFQLLDIGTRFSERTLKIGLIIDAIRNLNPELYDKEVGVPCDVV